MFCRFLQGHKKVPLRCAGAEEEINRRCHIYYTISYTHSSGSVKDFGYFFWCGRQILLNY